MKLTEDEESLLTGAEQAQYETAIAFCNDGWACGPYGGWVRGHAILKKLGWTEQTRTEGCRTFTSLCKPKRLTMQPNA